MNKPPKNLFIDCAECGENMPEAGYNCPHCGADIDDSTGEITYAGCWVTPVIRGK